MNCIINSVRSGGDTVFTLSGPASDVDSAVSDLRRKYPAIAYGTRVMERKVVDGQTVVKVHTYSAG